MICPVCKEAGLTSTVIEMGTSSTCLGFLRYHDEAGVPHSHNPNKHTTDFRCSNGHNFVRVYYVPCPSCGKVNAPEKIVIMR